MIAVGCELVGATGAFLECLAAIALEHEIGGAPDIDLGYHAGKTATLTIYKSLTSKIALRARIPVRVAAKWRRYGLPKVSLGA